MPKSCVQILVHGKVQGVYFRKYVQQIALSLNLSGFVRNQMDGSVYIEAIGDKEKIHKLVDWCNKGPQLASIEKVLVKEITAKQYSGFEIRKTE